ncbi:MAG: transposase [Cyanothece sp. SIO2G6]|nr:transposase [Cyanothece sp. SIO2G6]
MKPYSLDLRQRIIDSYTNGEGSIRQLAVRYKVSPDCVRRLLKRYRETNSIAPLPSGGHKPPLLTPSHREQLLALVEADHDATLVQLAARLEEQTQVKASPRTIGRALQQLNITRKKKVSNRVKLTPRPSNANGGSTGTSFVRASLKIWYSSMRRGLMSRWWPCMLVHYGDNGPMTSNPQRGKTFLLLGR